MDNLPKRDGTIYEEIESFEDYELTQCVAYEMAVRNKEVKTIINKLKYIKRIKNKLFNNYISLRKIENRNGNSKYKELWMNDMIDSMLNQKLKQNFFIDFGYTQIKEERGVVFLDEPMINKIISNMHENLDDIFAKKSQRYYRNNQKIRDGFIVSQGIFERENEFNKSSIKPNFKRSLLNRGKYTDIGIDLNQPLDEIIAYITHIKNDLKDNKDILKTPLELLGEKLQRADNMVCDSKGKCFDAREILSKQKKLADMFFIYDCSKVGMTQRKIQNEVYNYYADIGIETKTLDAKTLKKYKEIACDYIDNMRYKELVTGIKI